MLRTLRGVEQNLTQQQHHNTTLQVLMSQHHCLWFFIYTPPYHLVYTASVVAHCSHIDTPTPYNIKYNTYNRPYTPTQHQPQNTNPPPPSLFFHHRQNWPSPRGNSTKPPPASLPSKQPSPTATPPWQRNEANVLRQPQHSV